MLLFIVCHSNSELTPSIHFHDFLRFKSSNAPSEMPQTFVNAQMQVLNEGYSQTPFEFKLAIVQYVVNKTYYSSMAEPNDSNVEALYKQGGTNTLMVIGETRT